MSPPLGSYSHSVRFTIRQPENPRELDAYYRLRYEILRAPWEQTLGSERDEFEAEAFHIMAWNKPHGVIGCGRLHVEPAGIARIRYMAVRSDRRLQGLGTQLLFVLEERAIQLNCGKIHLNARKTCKDFYRKRGYAPIENGPTLFGSIEHIHMRKNLRP